MQLSSQCMGRRRDLNWISFLFSSRYHPSVNFSQNVKEMMVMVVFSDGFHQSLKRELKRKSINEIGIYQSNAAFIKLIEQNVSKVLLKYMSTLRTK